MAYDLNGMPISMSTLKKQSVEPIWGHADKKIPKE